MKKTLLALLSLTAVLSLASCAPVLTPQPPVPAPAGDPAPALLTLTTEPGQSYSAVSFRSGARDAANVKVTISGTALSANETRCVPTGPQLVCYLGSRPANAAVTLYVRGAEAAKATYVRPDGRTYTLTAP